MIAKITMNAKALKKNFLCLKTKNDILKIYNKILFFI